MLYERVSLVIIRRDGRAYEVMCFNKAIGLFLGQASVLSGAPCELE